MGICQQQALLPNSQIAEIVVEQTEMIYHKVRKIAIHAHTEYKAYYDL